MDEELYYSVPGTVHYNVFLKGGGVLSRRTGRSLSTLRPELVERIWIIEHRRQATAEEIAKLCAGK